MKARIDLEYEGETKEEIIEQLHADLEDVYDADLIWEDDEDRRHCLWATYDSEIQAVYEKMGYKGQLTKDQIDDVVYYYKKAVEDDMDNWYDAIEESIELMLENEE